MNRIGICTIYTGYNYGSALQAYAVMQLIKSIGYEPEVFKLSGSLKKGRDVRLKKMLVMSLRSIFHFRAGRKSARSYVSNYSTNISRETKSLFAEFYEKKISPTVISYNRLKRISKLEDYVAFVCGSDQIWNGSALYVDPFYYLEFAPESKRIAFAPSFGRTQIPSYNKNVIIKKVDRIPYLSIREEEGKRIIKDSLGKDAMVIVDPTLAVSSEEWKKLLDIQETDERYILSYFLNEPNEKAKKMIREEIEKGLTVIEIPSCYIINSRMDAGPIEFVQLVYNAERVYTDSFHGTAFSILFNKDFYSFCRNYGSASDQSSRIKTILRKVDLERRYDADHIDQAPIDYQSVNQILRSERIEALRYLAHSIEEVIHEKG